MSSYIEFENAKILTLQSTLKGLEGTERARERDSMTENEEKERDVDILGPG